VKKRTDTAYMRLALELAAKAKEKTYPNPMVGAVIVKGGRIIGRGYHRKAGADHAEVAAIKDAGSCRGAEMYVTLEPCDHYGRTPPCTASIIKSGIKKVNIAMKDPSGLNNGRGMRKLKKAGIRVSVGLLAEEAEKLNRKYIKFTTTGLPYITVKLAQSADGKIAARDGSSKWISSARSRRLVKKIRSGFDAIMVGANTVLRDDPLLMGVEGRSIGVSRVILDSRLRTPADSNVVRTAKKAPVIFGTTQLAPFSKIERFRRTEGVDVIVTRKKGSRVALRPFLSELAARGLVSIMVEGGGELVGSLIDESLVDEFLFFIAPKVIGGGNYSVGGKGVSNIKGAIELRDVEVKRSGSDIFIRGSACSRG